MCFLFMSHPVIFPAKSVTTEGALELPIPGMDHVMPLEVFTSRKPLVTLETLKPFLAGMSFGSWITRNLHFYGLIFQFYLMMLAFHMLH